MNRVTALTLLLVLLACLPLIGSNDAQYSRTVTLTTSTLTRVFNAKTMASSVLIQMLHGGTALGYVYSTDPTIACNTNNLVAELAPATSTSPGGSYSDNPQTPINLQWLCLSGSTGDSAVLSYRTAQ